MIRPYVQDDMPRILDIWLQASVKAHDFMPAGYWESQLEDMQDLYIPSSLTFVCANEAGLVQGFLSMQQQHIAAIFVHPEAQGKGLGRSLVDFAKSRYATLDLWVYAPNAAAITFYIRQGFVPIGQRIDALTGQEEWQMCYIGQLQPGATAPGAC